MILLESTSDGTFRHDSTITSLRSTDRPTDRPQEDMVQFVPSGLARRSSYVLGLVKQRAVLKTVDL